MVTVSGTSGADWISNSGDSFEPTIFIPDRDNIVIFAGDGDDSVELVGRGHRVYGGNGSDTFSFNTEQSRFEGGAGGDFFYCEGNANRIFGQDGNDYVTFYGSAAGNVFYGEAGNDFISSTEASAGLNSLFGGEGNDTINGGDAIIDAGTGDDFVYMQGNVTANGGLGTDHLVLALSQADFDALTRAQVTAINDFLSNPTGQTLSLARFGFARNFETAEVTVDQHSIGLSGVLLTDGNDVFVGSVAGEQVLALAGDDRIDGMGGDDTLFGMAGNDTLIGGDGNDQLSDSAGANLLDGGAGDDRLEAFSSDSTLLGGAGNDRFELSSFGQSSLLANRNRCDGGDGADVFTLEGDANTVSGGLGDDRIDVARNFGAGAPTGNVVRGDAGNDDIRLQTGSHNLLDGGEGNDDLFAGGSGNTVLGGLGNDAIYGYRQLTIDAGGGADRITVEETGNTVQGGSGSDAVTAMAGANVLDGGSETDYLTLYFTHTQFNGLTRAQFIQLRDYLGSPAGRALSITGLVDIRNFESIDAILNDHPFFFDGGPALNFTGTLLSDGNDRRTGTAGSDRIFAFAGNDRLDGGAGNDTLLGMNGDDTLIGGAGNDDLDGGAGRSSISGGAGNDRITAAGDRCTLDGGSGDDFFILGDSYDGSGGTRNSLINCGAGNDFVNLLGSDVTIQGGDGNDALYSGATNALIYGGNGDDWIGEFNGIDFVEAGSGHYFGGQGNDTYVAYGQETIVENAGEGIDTVYSEMLTYVLPENVENLSYAPFQGGPGRPVNFTGNDLDNIIAAPDYQDVGAGSVFHGGGGNDTIQFRTANYSDSRTVDSVFGEAGNDRIVMSSYWGDAFVSGGTGDDILISNAGDDDLSLISGNDTLDGGDGGDELTGRAGNDMLTGGAGADRFVFDALDNGRSETDVVTDYSKAGGDVLDLPGAQASILAALFVDGVWQLTLTGDDGDVIRLLGVVDVDGDGILNDLILA